MRSKDEKLKLTMDTDKKVIYSDGDWDLLIRFFGEGRDINTAAIFLDTPIDHAVTVQFDADKCSVYYTVKGSVFSEERLDDFVNYIKEAEEVVYDAKKILNDVYGAKF